MAALMAAEEFVAEAERLASAVHVDSPNRPVPPAPWADVARLWQYVYALERRLQQFEGAWARPPDSDAIGDWMEQNPAVLALHKGKHVAIHPERGIVAEGRSYGEVHDRVVALDLANEVAIVYVRQ